MKISWGGGEEKETKTTTKKSEIFVFVLIKGRERLKSENSDVGWN